MNNAQPGQAVRTEAQALLKPRKVKHRIRIRYRKKSNRGAGVCKWTVFYEFDVDDVTYSGYGFWHGTEASPALGLNKYHVGYLPAFPKINRLVKHDSIKCLIQEIKLPELPLPPIIRKKKKKKG